MGRIPSGGAVGALSTCQVFHDRADVNTIHLYCLKTDHFRSSLLHKRTEPKTKACTVHSNPPVQEASQHSPERLNLSAHPTVTSHTAACCHIVRPSLSMSLSPLRTTCAHPTANLSSHQERPLEFWLLIVLRRCCEVSQSPTLPQQETPLNLSLSAAHSNSISFSRSPLLGTAPLPLRPSRSASPGARKKDRQVCE